MKKRMKFSKPRTLSGTFTKFSPSSFKIGGNDGKSIGKGDEAVWR